MKTEKTVEARRRRCSKTSEVETRSISRSVTPGKSPSKNLGLKEQIIEKLNSERFEENWKKCLSFCEKKAGFVLNKDSKTLLELFENIVGLFVNLPQYSQLDSFRVIEQMREQKLMNNRTFQRLEMQNSLLKEATSKMKNIKERMKEIKDFRIGEGFFAENNLSCTKMNELELVRSYRIELDEFIKNLNYFNELPKNNVFSRLRIDVGKTTNCNSIDLLNSEMTLFDSLQSRIREFWNNYRKLEFLNCVMDEVNAKSSFTDMNHIFSLYIRVGNLLILDWILF